jgi:site-specific DNA recombinase
MVKDPDCKNRSWRVAELDALVLGEVEKLRLDPEALKKRKPKDPAPERDLIEKRVETLTRQIRRLMDLYSLETFSIEDIAEKIKPLEDERRNLRGLLKNAPKNSPEKDVGKIIETLSEALQASDLTRKRALIQQLIDKIELDGEDVTIFWNF